MKKPIWMLFLILPTLISHSQVDLHQLKQGQAGFGLSGQTGLTRLAETIRVAPVLSYGVFDAVEFHLQCMAIGHHLPVCSRPTVALQSSLPLV